MRTTATVRILVVDDHPSNRHILDAHLRRWGATVTIADSGAAALMLLKQAAQLGTPVDIALLDIHMPGMDGLALAEAITLAPDFPFVTLIALSSVDGLPEDTESQAKLFRAWIRNHPEMGCLPVGPHAVGERVPGGSEKPHLLGGLLIREPEAYLCTPPAQLFDPHDGR